MFKYKPLKMDAESAKNIDFKKSENAGITL